MAKYVQFNIKDGETSYVKVDDFNLETIKSLSLYNSGWNSIVCLEGEPRFFEGKILDIYPGRIVRVIYYGKRLSYEETKGIVGNDLRYKNLLLEMSNCGRQAFYDFCLYNNYRHKPQERDVVLNSFINEFDKWHHCLFLLPNSFEPRVLAYDNAITIEEFDPSIRLDYGKQLENIRMDAMALEEYTKTNKNLINMFKAYFDAVLSLASYFKEEDYSQLFSLISFDFSSVPGMNSVDDINYFLDVFAREGRRNSDYFDRLLGAYRKYINQKYDEKIVLS